MSKYQIGDKFELEIVDVDEDGMGVLYTCSPKVFVSDLDLDQMVRIEDEPLSEVNVSAEKPRETHTPDDLLSRILYLSKLLNDTIDKYIDIKNVLEVGVDNLDETIERLSL